MGSCPRKPEHLRWQLPAAAVRHTDVDAAERKSHTSKEYAKAVKETNTSDEHPLHRFYKTQSLQYLGEETDRESVPIWIAGYDNSSSESENVSFYWIEHIQRAISDINEAVPGLNLHTVSEKSKAIIKMAGTRKLSCFTRGSILRGGSAEIYLYPHWNNKTRTSCHELLHALGFGHEHQRPDRDFSIEVWSDTSQYKKLDDLYGVTRFDPYSIMLYLEDEEWLRRSGDPVWFTKPSYELNIKMSELDKMGVNNLYRPCKRTGYSPVIGSTGLFYCGRYFGVQFLGHDGYCRPNNGVNCPACRVLKTDRVVALWQKGKWQGWTGAIYCGSYFGVQWEGHDGYCGPDNGPQCPECYNELTQ